MRKKKLMALSLFLVVIQIVALLAIIPASAASGRYYAIYKTDTAPVLNGVEDSSELWNKVPWSEDFHNTTGDVAPDGFSAKFKMMWSENAEKNTVDLWYFIYVKDSTTTAGSKTSTNWTNDYFALSIANGATKLYSNGRVEIDLLPDWENREGNTEYIDESTKNESVASFIGVDVDLGWQDNRADKGYYTFEYMVSIPANKVGSNINFDVMINDHTSGAKGYSRNAWSSMNNTDIAAPLGRGLLSNISAGIADKVAYDPSLELAKGYTFLKADAAPTEDDWSALEWLNLSESFKKTATSGSDREGFTANFKALWVDNAETVDLWFCLLVEDDTDIQKSVGKSGWTDDHISLSVDANRDGDDDDSGEIDSNFRAELENIGTDGKISYFSSHASSQRITFELTDDRAEDGCYVMTMCVPISKALITDNTLNFDIMVNDCGSASSDVYTRIGWNGMNSTGYVGKGIGYLSMAKADEIMIATQAGAGVRLDNPTGLRFESRVNKDLYDKAVANGAEITTGTIILPTDYLTEYGLNNANFNKYNLDVLGIKYLDVVNEGWVNKDTAETDGYYKYYGSIVGIKEANLDREFSGIGYVTVKTDNGEYTVYSDYKAEHHSRSVQYVANAAIASGEYNDYLDILQGFIKTSDTVGETIQLNAQLCGKSLIADKNSAIGGL